MALTEGQLKLFADFIQKNIGIVYRSENYFQLEKRLEDIAKILQLKSSEDLYSIASRGITGQLKDVLLDVATNNETSFFRDPSAFRLVEEKILPDLAAKKDRVGKIKIWSCASSFGQEPYSLAMLSHEFMQKNPSSLAIEVCATDISDQALGRAKAGLYSQLEVQRGLGAARLVKYFSKNTEDMWQVSADIKKHVRFSKQNLLEPISIPGPFDLVFCRYVLIYQTDEKKKEIIGRIAQALSPKAYLVMGGSESLIGLSQAFDQINLNGAVAYQKK